MIQFSRMLRLHLFRVLGTVFIFLSGLSAHAGVIGALGAGMQFEYASNGHSLEMRTPFSLRGGYHFRLVDTYFEYSRFSTSDGASYIGVDRVHSEYLIWARHIIVPRWRVAPFAALGAGAQVDDVHLRFQDANDDSRGGPQTVWAVAMGLIGSVTKTFNIQLEGRAETSPENAPNPELGASLLLGFTI